MSSGWGGGFGAGSGPPSPEDKSTAVMNVTLNAGHITAKGVTLNDIPTVVQETRLAVVGGSHAIYGTSFTVSGNFLSWASLGLDGLLVAGDEVVIRYPVNII